MRYFIFFAYDGTNYHGWQAQPNAASVQQQLDRALSLLLRSKIETLGAGRTDAGVHAAYMAAHFDAPEPIDCKQTVFKLNRMLPPDIAVSRIAAVRPEAHARFDALARTYHYYIYTEKNPFRRHYAARFPFSLDFERMNRAAELLLQTSDFTSFSKLHTDAKTNICRVTKARWEETEPGLWRFEITADRFLRNMVRAVVGTLIDVGRGRISEKDFADIIAQKNRCAAGESVPGNALSLVNIVYPQELFLAD